GSRLSGSHFKTASYPALFLRFNSPFRRFWILATGSSTSPVLARWGDSLTSLSDTLPAPLQILRSLPDVSAPAASPHRHRVEHPRRNNIPKACLAPVAIQSCSSPGLSGQKPMRSCPRVGLCVCSC